MTNPIPAEELPTQAELRELFTYCALSGALRWRTGRGGQVAGALAGSGGEGGYRNVYVNGRHLRAHRVIWCWYHGNWPDETIDHVNGAKWDNRIFNLREASRLEQVYNRPVLKSNKSGFVGVHWVPERKKFRSRIRINGVKTHLGYFDCPEEAARVRDEKAKEVQGEFYRET